jgi:hypothetical protein
MASAFVAIVLPRQALADSNARIVRLSYVDGAAQIDRRDGRGFEQAFLNMPLAPGTRVATLDDGRAEVEFEDMSTVRLTPGTSIETQSLDLRSSGAKYTLIDLQDGTAYFNIRKLQDDDDFRVTTGRREFSLTRASRFRLRVDHQQVVLAVFSGEVEVIGDGSQLTVRKNEMLTLDLDDPSRYFLAKGVSSDRYDDWDHERDEYRDRYASAGNYRGYSPYYSYGITDLNYWGSYTYFPGYGYMWRPYSYSVGWNPFNDGGWYWYPGYGWIWVSGYPWGWMPFRYGNWYYISGFGWCWHPGNHWHSWSPVVVVHNAPPGHVVPTPPPPSPTPSGHHDPIVVGHGPTTSQPPEDLGLLRRGVRDPATLGRKGESPAGGPGTLPPGSGPVAAPIGGSGLTPGSRSSGLVGSGGGQPAADPTRRPTAGDREVELEQAIRNARERRAGSGTGSGGIITNSAPGSSGSVSSGSGGSGAVSPPASPGSDPFAGHERPVESRRPAPQQDYVPSAGPSGSSSSGSGSSSGYTRGGSSGSSGGGSGYTHTSPSPSSGSSGSSSSSWRSSGGTSSGSSGGSSGSGGRSSSSGGSSFSGGSHTSSGGHSSNSGSTKSSSPK